VAENQINPEKVTKPFQLLATWLLGLISLTGLLIWASMGNYETKWINCFYAISAVAIIPLFLLQTVFRPEMQEDKYYNPYLLNKYNKDLSNIKPIDLNEVLKEWKKK